MSRIQSNPIQSKIPDYKKDLIDKMLLEKISLVGIARVVSVSERGLQNYVNKKYKSVPLEVEVVKKKDCQLTIECDELWSFVGKHDEKQWVWLAMDRDTREIVSVYIGDRGKDSAKELWLSLPAHYQANATAYTDFWESYYSAFPKSQHRAVGKESGKTNHIERFNCTLCQRVSRLVRKSLSFSKKLDNHIGAIFYFIHHYNAMRRAAMCYG